MFGWSITTHKIVLKSGLVFELLKGVAWYSPLIQL